MKKTIFLFLVFCLGQIISLAQPLNHRDTTLNEHDKIIQFQKYIEDGLNHLQQEEQMCNHISAYSDIEGVITSRMANRLSIISIVIASVSTLLTLLIFLIQSRINARQKLDITTERFENHLFGCIDHLNNYVDNIEIYNVAKGRKSFNYLFYEYEMLFNVFKQENINSIKSNTVLSNSELSSLAISFIINGITPNVNGGDKDIIYPKYKDILNKEDYMRLVKIVDHYENIKDEELQELYDNNEYTLIVNYANIKLKEGKRVPWFWGIRFYYIPYIKQLHNIFSYISELDDKIKKDKYLNFINSSFNDTELGLLNAFVASKENIVGINENDVKIIIEKCKLDNLYNYNSWSI